MSSQYVNTILNAVKTVFISMLDMGVSFKNPLKKNAHHPQYDVSCVIKIAGELNYWIVVSYSKEMARIVASEMLGEPLTCINDDLTDAIGEISNMVIGVADTALELEGITYTLPEVCVGSNRIIYPEGSFIFSMPCKMDTGDFEVDIVFPQEAPNHAGGSKP